MSDIEEPPAKVVRVEMGPPSLDSTMAEEGEGQEEWLSEGVLTDDDCQAAAASENPELEQQDANMSNADTTAENTSQDSTALESTVDNAEAETEAEPAPAAEASEPAEEPKLGDIEQKLDDLENSKSNGLPEELNTFLIRKTDGKIMDKEEKESDIDESVKQSDDDDGHNTDDLLRMLGEGDDKDKQQVLKRIKVQKSMEKESASSDDDDDYIFEGAKVTRLRVAKNAIRKYPAPRRAMPENLSDDHSDMSDAEDGNMNKIFQVRRLKNVASKSTSRSHNNSGSNKTVKRDTVKVTRAQAPRPQSSRPPQLYRAPQPAHSAPAPASKPADDEPANEEEFLDEDAFDFEDEMIENSRGVQRIMRPERMEEEPPSDPDTDDDDVSLYDELPSSESEATDDWFTLDIRAERAGDYLPLLGDRGAALLLAERRRVAARVSSLRQALAALGDSARAQAARLRAATTALADTDAMLAAS